MGNSSKKQQALRTIPVSSLQARVRLCWVHSANFFPSNLFKLVLRVICTYLCDQPFVTYLDSRSIKILNIETYEWSTYELSRMIFNSAVARPDCFHRYAFVGDTHLIACGGIDSGTGLRPPSTSRAAFLVSIAGRVSKLSRMLQARGCHGLIFSHRSLFVFGGSVFSLDGKWTQLRHSEAFSLTSGKWTEVPPLQRPRSNFTPCEWKAEIYICGGRGTGIEVFSPETYAYRTIPGVLEECNSVTFRRGGELVHLSYNFIAVFRYSDGRLMKYMDLRNEKVVPVQAAACSVPILVGGKVFVAQEQWCSVFDMSTGRLDREIRASQG